MGTPRRASTGRVLFGFIIRAFLMSVTVAYTLTSTNLGTSTIKLAKETFSDDTDVVVASNGIYKQRGTGLTASGDVAPGVESDNTLPVVTNGGGKNRYVYEFEVKEAASNSLSFGENLKIQVYLSDGASTSLLATLYMKQDMVNDVSVEGSR